MSRKQIKLLIIAGARPNFMKIAPIIRTIQSGVGEANRFEFRLIHTGQHYDAKMSEVFFEELGIPRPDFNLEVGSGSHAVQTAQVMLKFEPVLVSENPDWVVVVGDINSTAACTLVAAKLGIKVAHVEAGLRSFDRSMPEEINRLVTDAISDLLLTPSADADENLRREGIPAGRIVQVGNIMIDSLVENLKRARGENTFSKLGVESGKFAYVTLHRPANVDDKQTLTTIMEALRRVSESTPLVFPMHPRTRKMMREFGITGESSPRLTIIEPVGYLDSIALTEGAAVVVTDSGGLQEEATYFRTPCLTLRPNTERPVTIDVGSNQLTTPAKLHADMSAVLAGPRRRGQQPALWDGATAGRILKAIAVAT